MSLPPSVVSRSWVSITRLSKHIVGRRTAID
jgi:hypothetical protein